MRSTGVGKDGWRGERAQQGRLKRVFIVGIVRLQSGEEVEVGEMRDGFGVYNGGKRKIGMREGRGCVERGKMVYETVGGGVGGGRLFCLSVCCLSEGAGAEAGAGAGTNGGGG